MHSAPTTLLLVRHAQTIWNREQRHTGSSEIGLAPEAENQIGQLTRRLLAYQPEALYSSPLTRCVLTIQPLADILQLPIDIHKELQERHLGEWEGHTPLELQPTHPGYRYPFSAYNGDFRIPGAEPLEDVQHRIREMLHTIAEHNLGKKSIVSTHSGIIWTVLHRVVVNPPTEDIWPPNCSITVIERSGNHWRLKNFQAHF